MEGNFSSKYLLPFTLQLRGYKQIQTGVLKLQLARY